MSFRNWLLTGTSLTLLAFAPLSVARADRMQPEATPAAAATSTHATMSGPTGADSSKGTSEGALS